jgi:acetolactate synthase-1/2/3 large subunit
MLGSHLVIRTLARRGVRTIFSLSGNQIMPLYDACIDAGIRIVHVRHEAAAVFMADAWSQVTGEVGVALLTAGPGITNGVAPLYSAAQAESPVLLLSGDSPLAEDGMGAFQEMDQAAITRPLTKASRRVDSREALAGAVDDAVALALAPRRGPVHLALPFDLLRNDAGLESLPPMPPASDAPSPSETDVAALATLLAQASRPIVLGGSSAARAHAQATWRDLEARLQVPVLALESPRGLRDPSLGAFAEALARSDVVVLAGKRLDFTVGFGRPPAISASARVVVLDPDPSMIARATHMLGDRLALACRCEPAALLERAARARAMPARGDWLAEVAAAVASRSLPTTAAPAAGAIGPRALCDEVQRFLAAAHDPILVCDGGEFGQWAQAFCTAPVRIVNGTSGAIGGGLCYALAAKIARPEATVVALMGDGTSGFHFMEFDTAVRERAPFVAVIGNDLRWNAEHMIQLRTYGPDRLIGCGLAPSARYDEAAKALGGFGASVSREDALRAALRDAAASGLPACINVALDGQPAPNFASVDNPANRH